jgi:hypothetical protein
MQPLFLLVQINFVWCVLHAGHFPAPFPIQI